MLGLEVKIKSDVIVFFKKNSSILLFKGPLGQLLLEIPPYFLIKKTKTSLFILPKSKLNKSLLFTFGSLIRKRMLGVSQGFFVILDIRGIGWQVMLENSNVLVFKLGFSNLIKYSLASSIEAFIINKQKLKIFGLDLYKVNQVVAILCSLRKVDVYKGKGVIKENSKLKLKLSSKFK